MNDHQFQTRFFRDMLGLVRAGRQLMHCLSAEEVQRRGQDIVAAIRDIVCNRLALLPDPSPLKDMVAATKDLATSPDVLTLIENTIRALEADVKAVYKKRRDPKPRNTERDKAIIRLRDEQRLTFGQIPRQLRKENPVWVASDGELLSKDTVEKAYKRAKGRLADTSICPQ